MQIQAISNYKVYSINKPSPVKQNSHSDFITFSGRDIFIHSDKNNILKKFKNFSINEYLRLSPQELQTLREEYITACADKLPLYQRFEKIHDITASCMKNFFDGRFKNEKYIVIPIGRSLSSIGKVLGYKIGEENVKNIPLSDAKRFNYHNNLINASENGEIDCFKKFLQSIGLDVSNVKNSNNKYILTDYTCSCYSLSGAKKLFQFIFEQENDKFFTFDITGFFEKLDINNPEIKLVKKYLETDLFSSKYKNFSFVNYCPNLKDTQNAIKNIDEDLELVNLFRFKLLDNEMQNPEMIRKPLF